MKKLINKKIIISIFKIRVPLVVLFLLLIFYFFGNLKNENFKEKFQPFSKNQENILNFASAQSFPDPDLTIGIIADAHAGQENGFQRLALGINTIKEKEKINFLVNLGDLIEGRSSYKKIDRDLAKLDLIRANEITSRYHKVYDVLGNHEVFSLSKEDALEVSGKEDHFFSFIEAGYQIIILDANFSSSGAVRDVDNKNKIVYNGFLPSEQLDWLKEKLKNNDKNIIFIHHPIYGLDNSLEVEKIISENKERILLIANGHRHPEVLRFSTFAGVPVYEIPSLEFQKEYSILKLFEREIFLNSKRFE